MLHRVIVLFVLCVLIVLIVLIVFVVFSVETPALAPLDEQEGDHQRRQKEQEQRPAHGVEHALIGGRAFFSFVRRAKYERTSTEQPSESSRFDDDADDDGTQSRPSCSFGRRPSTEPRSSTKMYPNLTPCAATSPDASVGYPCASGARHTEAYCSSLSWNGTKPGPAAGTTAVERGGERGRSSISR